MSIICVLLFLSFSRIHCQWVLRQYIVEKDFFSGIKSGEFSVYDPSRRNLLYRLESRYTLTQTAELYAYPTKQLVASIRNTWSPWIYDAGIQIYDFGYNQWISGRITQSFIGYGFRYIIQFGNRRLIMNHGAFSFTINISDEQNRDYLLAQIKIKLSSLIWSNKYDLLVYTDELPDPIYILAIAAYDYGTTRARNSNQNGK